MISQFRNHGIAHNFWNFYFSRNISHPTIQIMNKRKTIESTHIIGFASENIVFCSDQRFFGAIVQYFSLFRAWEKSWIYHKRIIQHRKSRKSSQTFTKKFKLKSPWVNVLDSLSKKSQSLFPCLLSLNLLQDLLN